MSQPYFEMRHTIGFEETNLVGNVYFTNHIKWQGRCREMFLCEHAPSVLSELEKDLALITVHVSCDYFDELFAFDEIVIRMRAGTIVQNRINMLFEYLREGSQEIIAKGEQMIACMRRTPAGLEATVVPEVLKTSLILFGDKLND